MKLWTTLLLLAAAASADTVIASGILGPGIPSVAVEAELSGVVCLQLDGERGDLDLLLNGRRADGVGPDELLFGEVDGAFRTEVVWRRGAPGDYTLSALVGERLGAANDGAHLALEADQQLGLWRLPDSKHAALQLHIDGPGTRWFVLDARLDILAAPELQHCSVPLASAPTWLVLLLPEGSPAAAWDLQVQGAPLAIQDAFLAELATEPQQQAVLESFRRQPDGRAMLRYLAEYPGGYPLKLKSEAGLMIGGVERFGGYDGFRGELIVNPTKSEHVENPLELLDTVAHELLHAILDLPREADFPFATDVLDSQIDPRLRRLNGLLNKRRVRGELKTYLEQEYGDGISNPEDEYIDINAAAQRLVIKIVEAALEDTGFGYETQVFENERARESGK